MILEMIGEEDSDSAVGRVDGEGMDAEVGVGGLISFA